jgi:hypothetical protein
MLTLSMSDVVVMLSLVHLATIAIVFDIGYNWKKKG